MRGPTEPSNRTPRATFWVAVGLLLLLALAAFIATVYVGFLPFGCGPDCDADRAGAAIIGFRVAAVVIVFLSAAGLAALRRRGQWSLIPPILGFALLALAYWIPTEFV